MKTETYNYDLKNIKDIKTEGNELIIIFDENGNQDGVTQLRINIKRITKLGIAFH